MKHKYKLFFIIILNILSYRILAQPWMQSPYFKINTPEDSLKILNFYEIQKAFESYERDYYKKKGDKFESDEEEGEGIFPGYAHFKRWECYMEPRVFPTGDITLPYLKKAAYYKSLQAGQSGNNLANKSAIAGNWIPLGPTGTHWHGYFGGAGRLSFLRIDPSNSNTMWTFAPTGGLWKTIDGGLNWTTNTDLLPIIGCSDIAINPLNTQVMYLATGDGNGAMSQLGLYSLGILKSTDGGLTWPDSSNTMNWQVSWGRSIYK